MYTRYADLNTDRSDLIEIYWDFIEFMGDCTWLPNSVADAEAHFLSLLNMPGVDTIVCEESEKVTAAISTLTSPFVFNPEIIHVEEIFWWAAHDADPRAAMLVMRAAMNWAETLKDKNEVMVTMKRLEKSPRGVRRVYDRFDLSHIETSHSGMI
jgi:hypothetical protein